MPEQNMMQNIPTFLPIIWAVVSTIIALILYRTSSGLFERTDEAEDKKTTRLRLTGLIVIAAVVFFGLWKTTDASALRPSDQKQITYMKRDLESFAQNSANIQKRFTNLQLCLGVSSKDNCADELEELGNDIDAINSQVNNAVKGDDK